MSADELPREIARASIEIVPGVVAEVSHLSDGRRVVTNWETVLQWLMGEIEAHDDGASEGVRPT